MSRHQGIIAAIVGLSLLCVVFYKANPLTKGAQAYARDVAVASAGTYVTLRTINAFLSTAQEVEVGGSLVVQGTVQPLKVLEPIDDTIERIAGLVFAVMVVTGLLAVAMGPLGAVGWAMIGLASAVALTRPRWRTAGWCVGQYGLIFALGLPLAFIGASLLADWMTAEVWAEHSAIIATVTDSVAVTEADQNWMQSAWSGIDRYQTLAERLLENADALIGSYIAILAVFFFKIFVLPAVLMGLFWALSRATLPAPGR